MVLGQDEENHAKTDDIEGTDRKRVLVAQPGRLTVPPICSPLTSWWPISSHFVCLKISKLCSLTMPFFESRSSWKVKNAKKKLL
jgi:hypothetical protein